MVLLPFLKSPTSVGTAKSMQAITRTSKSSNVLPQLHVRNSHSGAIGHNYPSASQVPGGGQSGPMARASAGLLRSLQRSTSSSGTGGGGGGGSGGGGGDPVPPLGRPAAQNSPQSSRLRKTAGGATALRAHSIAEDELPSPTGLASMSVMHSSPTLMLLGKGSGSTGGGGFGAGQEPPRRTSIGGAFPHHDSHMASGRLPRFSINGSGSGLTSGSNSVCGMPLREVAEVSLF